MSLADVQITLAASALIAHVTGEVDMSNAEEVGATVIGATPNEAQGVILDLSGVDYLDSAGIYVIYGMRASLQARGQAMILVIPPTLARCTTRSASPASSDRGRSPSPSRTRCGCSTAGRPRAPDRLEPGP